MQLHIATFLNIVLALSTVGYCRPPHDHKSLVVRHEGHDDGPKSDLSSVVVSMTSMETIRAPVSSTCLFTHTFQGNLMTMTRPCSPKSRSLKPTVTSGAGPEATNSRTHDMCTHTHTHGGTAVFTRTMACSMMKSMSGQDKISHTTVMEPANETGIVSTPVPFTGLLKTAVPAVTTVTITIEATPTN